jgi:hypothetical protein
MMPSRGGFLTVLLFGALLLCGVLAEKSTLDVLSLSTQEIEEQLQVRTESNMRKLHP